jgi:flagellar biosynthesis protein FliQ
MDSSTLLHVFSMATLVAVKVVAPMLLSAVIIGLAVSLFQALTQINEATLAFIPKVIVMITMLWLLLPWMVRELVTFTVQAFAMAAEASR